MDLRNKVGIRYDNLASKRVSKIRWELLKVRRIRLS